MNNLLSESKNIIEYQNIKGLMRVWENKENQKNKFFLVVTIIFCNIAMSNLT